MEKLQDGLYRVVTEYFVAGFVVKNGVVVRYPPILRKGLEKWVALGEYVGP